MSKPYDLEYEMTEKELSLHPFCNTCGWRKGGLDSWNGSSCKCGHSDRTFRELFAAAKQAHAAIVKAMGES